MQQDQQPRQQGQQKEDCETDSLSTVPNCYTHNAKRSSVQFKDIEIHSFEPTLGDHPECRAGAPIALSDNMVDFRVVTVDEYERQGKVRRSKNELYMDRAQRRSILLSLQYSRLDIYKAEMAVRKAQRNRETPLVVSEEN